MSDDPLVEERVRRVSGRAVKILIDNHDVARSVILAQAPDGRHAQDVRDSELLQRIDVRPVVQLMRRDLVMFAVTRQKHDFMSVQLAFEQLRLGSAERSFRIPAVPHIEMIDSVKSASADDRKFHDCNSLNVFWNYIPKCGIIKCEFEISPRFRLDLTQIHPILSGCFFRNGTEME